MVKRFVWALFVVVAVCAPAAGQGLTQPALVPLDHPNRISCVISSTAVVSTTVTGCTAPGAGLAIYLTSIQWSSSIIGTTANFLTIQDGTGGNCAAAVTVRYYGVAALAFDTQNVVFQTPIRADTISEICFLHPGAGTRWINIQGYIAP